MQLFSKSNVYIYIILIFIILNVSARSQTVETLGVPFNTNPESIAVDGQGNLFIVSPPPGLLWKMKTDGSYITLFGGFNLPVGGGFDGQGNYYLANFNSGIISKITPDSSITRQYASGISGPVGVIPDPTNTFLYVAGYNSNSIVKINLSDSTVTPFTSSPLLNGPDGFAYDDIGNLYLANFNDSRINKIDTNGTVTTLATFPGNGIGYITWAKGFLYVAGLNNNKIYKVSPSGDTSTVAGTGVAGNLDGPANTAQFNRPNGIAASITGDTLFVGDVLGRRIRMVILSSVGIQNTNSAVPDEFRLDQNYPNPFNPETKIRFDITSNTFKAEQLVKLDIINTLGQQVALLVNEVLNPGSYEYTFNGEGLTSGIYYYKLSATDGATEFSQTKSMLLIK